MTERLTIKMTESEYHQHVSDSDGVCLACGEWRSDCEPDAEGYPCESCGEAQVMGVENALIEERIDIVADNPARRRRRG